MRPNGVNTNGAAAKVMNVFRQIEEQQVGPGTLGKIKVGEREYPKSPSVKNINVAMTPLVLTPFVPFRTEAAAVSGAEGTSIEALSRRGWSSYATGAATA